VIASEFPLTALSYVLDLVTNSSTVQLARKKEREFKDVSEIDQFAILLHLLALNSPPQTASLNCFRQLDSCWIFSTSKADGGSSQWRTPSRSISRFGIRRYKRRIFLKSNDNEQSRRLVPFEYTYDCDGELMTLCRSPCSPLPTATPLFFSSSFFFSTDECSDSTRETSEAYERMVDIQKSPSKAYAGC